MEMEMIETVVALLMLVNNEIKEHRIMVDGMAQCLRGKRQAERQYSENVTYSCIRTNTNTWKRLNESYIK